MSGRENAGLVFLLFKPAFLLIVPSLFSSPIWAWELVLFQVVKFASN